MVKVQPVPKIAIGQREPLNVAAPKINMTIDLVNNFQSQIDQIVVEGSIDPETAQARVDTDGDAWTTLKERLDTEHSAVTSQLADIAIDVKTIPDVIYDGVTDDSVALQSYIDNTNFSSLKLLFPSGVCVADITVSKPHVSLVGKGTIKGSVTLDAPIINNIQQELHFDAGEVTFDKNINDYGIRLIKARKFDCKDVKFLESISKPIYFEEAATYSQMTAKVTIDKCKFYGDYSLYFVTNSTTELGVGDVHFTNNMCQNKISNVYLRRIDGFIEYGNTYFLPGNSQQSPTKMRNLDIDYVNWCKIGGSHYFEAGLESIKILHFQNLIIGDVSIAWPGQRVMSSGILLSDGDVSNGNYNISQVGKITVMFPTKHGVEIGVGCGDISVADVFVRSAGGGQYYYGTEDLTAIEHYSVDVASGLDGISVSDINSPTNNANIRSGSYHNIIGKDRLPRKSIMTFTMNTNDRSLDPTGYNHINLAQPSATTINSIVEGFPGQEITLFAFNGNTTVSNSLSNGIYLKGGVDAKIPDRATLSLKYATGAWYEVGRSF